jgi:solute carrier family 32 (vesicular inhibitory amino acid transporter)
MGDEIALGEINKKELENEVSKSFLPHPTKLQGLSILTAAVFIVGEMAGTGVLSLSAALNASGWIGIAIIIICCLLSAYCGLKLSNCWTVLLESNEELRDGARDPYPLIAYEAAGNFGRYLVALICYIQLFGVAVIFLLIAASNIRSLLSNFVVQFCDWTIIIALIMCPISMLGTPKDFWPVAVGAMLFTAIACLFIFIQSLRQACSEVVIKDTRVTFKTFFIAFGTILFCFGGAVIFPSKVKSSLHNRG